MALVSGTCSQCSCSGFRAASVTVSRRLVFALILVLATAAHGQRYVDVETAVLVTPDGGVTSVDGGAWLSTDAIDAAYAERQRLAAENASLRTSPPPTPAAIAVALVVGLVAGAVVATWAVTTLRR